MAFLPFWPAVADAYSKHDINWLKRLYAKSMKIMILIGVPLFLILLFSTKSLIFFWTKNKTVIPSFNIVGIGILFTALSVWNTISCTFLNGMSHFKSQAIWGTLIAVLSILIAISFRKIIGVSGVFGIITIGMFIRCIVLAVDLKNRLKVI
jgi:O-antigen/teichoic acid export membrane protein